MDSWASTMPRERSLLSNRALPPVSTASAYMVSCDFWKLVVLASAEEPEYMPTPPGDPLVASPIGAMAIRPRASTAKKVTLARMAALVVAWNWDWLSMLLSLRPLAK